MRPGRVTAWVPTAAGIAAVQSGRPDPRRLTVEQEQHLSAAMRGRTGSEAPAPWLGLSCRLEHAVPDAVAAALASFFDRHESLRCDYVPDADGFTRRVVDAGDVEFEPVALGDHATAEDAHAVVADHLASQALSGAWPRAGFVSVEDGADVVLYAAFDPVTFDVASMHAAAAELPALHRVYARGDGPAPSLAPRASHLDHAEARRARLVDVASDDQRLQPWRDFLAHGGLALPSTAGNRSSGRGHHDLVSMPLATAGETLDLVELSEEWEVSLQQCFVALLLRAVAGQEGVAPYAPPVLLETSGRSAGDEGAVGWFSRLLPLRVEVDPLQGLGDAVARTAEVHARALQGDALTLGEARALLDGTTGPGLVVAFDDHRAEPGAPAATAGARGFVGHVRGGDRVHLRITCLPEGTFLEAGHPATPECGAWVATLAVSMRRALLAELDPLPVFTTARL